MNLAEYKGVYVFAQQVDNEVSGIALELIGKGKDLAKDLDTDVTAVLIGSDVKGLVDVLAEYGADKVIVVVPGEFAVIYNGSKLSSFHSPQEQLTLLLLRDQFKTLELL